MPSSPTRSTTTSCRWRTMACCAWGVDPSTLTNADADAGTTPMTSPPPHRHEHSIGISRPQPHQAAAGGRICDCLRGADPRGDVFRGGVHGDWPNLVHGCGADGTRRGREGVSLGSSSIQGTPRRRPHSLGGDGVNRNFKVHVMGLDLDYRGNVYAPLD